MGQNESNVSLDAIDERTKGHSKRLEVLEKKAEELPRLETLMEMVIKTNEEQSITLKNINENLTGLNVEMKNMGKEVSKLGNRVQKLEENDDSKKIDLGLLAKQIIWVGVPTIVIGVVALWLGLK